MDYLKYIDQNKKINKFKNLCGMVYTINMYLFVILNSLLGDKISTKLLNLPYDKLELAYHTIINLSDISKPEKKFFNKLVKYTHTYKIGRNTNYIDGITDLFNSTSGLLTCEDGPIILECLEFSKNIKFT